MPEARSGEMRAGSVSMRLYDALGRAVAILGRPLLPLLAVSRVGAGLSERLGELPPAVRALAGRRPFWLHAASVGEALACGPLVTALRERWPDLPVMLTTTSLTGREAARRLPGVDAVMLLPLDLRPLVTAALRVLRPGALLIVETEIWPALLRAAAEAGIPAMVVSGRVSERASRRYRLIRPLLRDTFRCVTAFGMQTETDAERVLALGAERVRVHITGSLKYARLLPSATGRRSLPGTAGRPVVVAASTQPGEEEVVLEAHAALAVEQPDCVLLLAPRRPERFAEVAALLQGRGLCWQRRSSLGEGVEARTQVVLLDSLGELPTLLGGARAVFVGGTISPLGGHNVLEPAAAGTPVCFGPHTENVAEAAASLVAAGGGAVVRNANELQALWLRLLADPDAARAMGAAARRVVEARARVLVDTLALVERALP